MLLVVSELATNAVMHARTRYLVELSVDGLVRVEVTDRSDAWPPLDRVTPYAVGGRGLQVVAALRTRWGIDWLDDGKVVWAEVELDARSVTIVLLRSGNRVEHNEYGVQAGRSSGDEGWPSATARIEHKRTDSISPAGRSSP